MLKGHSLKGGIDYITKKGLDKAENGLFLAFSKTLFWLYGKGGTRIYEQMRVSNGRLPIEGWVLHRGHLNTFSDDVLFGIPINTIYLPKDHSITLASFVLRFQKVLILLKKTLDYTERIRT